MVITEPKTLTETGIRNFDDGRAVPILMDVGNSVPKFNVLTGGTCVLIWSSVLVSRQLIIIVDKSYTMSCIRDRVYGDVA